MSLTAYQTGVASDPADLLTKLGTFAAANGWTVNAVTGGVVFVKGPVVVGAATDADELFFRPAITYNGASAWNAQDNASTVSLPINLTAGPYTAYHFFVGAEGGQDYLHGVVEIASNIFRHFVLGTLVKSGTYTGGTYVDGVRWSTSSSFANQPNSNQHHTITDANTEVAYGQVWCDHDAKTNNWQYSDNASDYLTTHMTGNGRSSGMLDTILQNFSYLRYNLRTPLWPAQYFVNRASSLRSLVGRIPDFRHLSMDQFVPGDIITIGGVDWMIFPVVQRTDTSGSGSSSTQASQYQAYGYRKN